MRIASIYFRNIKAGILTEDENGYHFQYDKDYLTSTTKVESISLTLPLQELPFTNDMLFPFFDGLIPEGWLLDIAQKTWKLDARDRMGLLLACCKDCIGVVSVVPMKTEEE